MKTIIAGSRDIIRYDILLHAIKEFGFTITEVVSGTARGADQLGEKWARLTGTSLKQFPADWQGLGKRAGYVRNKEMAAYADAAIILWDGSSKGTKHMIDLAIASGLHLYVWNDATKAAIGGVDVKNWVLGLKRI